MKRLSCLIVGCALFSLLLTGCGSGLQSVTGQVLFDSGKPVTGGQVVFQPTDKENVAYPGDIKEDGSFELLAPPGSYVAVVEGPDDDSPKTMTVHYKYADPTTSNLKYDVTSGDNRFEIRVKQGPPPSRMPQKSEDDDA